MKAVVLYASEKGSTAEIADRIAYTMQELGIETDLIDSGAVNQLEPIYDAVLLLTPIYKGLWLPQMTHFVRRNRDTLQDRPIYGLFPCIRVLEQSGKQYAYANYLPHQLIDHLHFVDMRFIAGKLIRNEITIADTITLNERYDGEQLARISGDYRDWGQIHAWVHGVVAQLKALQKRPAQPQRKKIVID